MPEVPEVKEFTLPYLWRLKNDSIGRSYVHHDLYGEIYRKRFHGYENYYIRHPKFFEHILETKQDNYQKHPLLIEIFKPFVGDDNLFLINDMNEWSRLRETCKINFQAEVYFERYTNTIAVKTAQMLDKWQEKHGSGPFSLNVSSEVDKLILSIINNTVFYKVAVDVEELANRLPVLLDLIMKKAYSFTRIEWILPTKRKQRYNDIIQFVQNLSRDVLLERLSSNRQYDDILSCLLHAYSVTDEKSPSFDLVKHQIALLNAVGYLTTMAALTWAFNLLARYPEMQERIAGEVDEVFHGNVPTYKDLSKLTYTSAFLCEVQRLHSTPFIFREAIEADEIMGYPISAKGLIKLNLYLAHRHPEFWENPDNFDPERFIKKRWGQDYQYAYVPFGIGKRGCIGKNFSFTEMLCILAMISQRFRLKVPPGADLDSQTFFTPLSLRPTHKMLILEAKK